VARKEDFNTILGEFYDESKTILISTHQVEEVEQILQDIIFIDKGRVVLSEDIEKLKNQYAIYTVNADNIGDLEKHNPRLINRTLGKVIAILPIGLEIETASQSKPSLSDLFMYKVGGSNE
jgi:ABC-2 type transport system ATP-binding protein